MNRRCTMALAAALLMSLTACGSTTDAESSTEPSLDPDVLTVYSAQHANLVDAWVTAFTAQSGVQVQVRQGKDASMGNQIIAEGATSPADVFLTENSPAMTVVQDAGLLAPVEATTLEQVEPAYRPANGEWVGIAARSTVLVYNPTKVSENELPASLMDLQDPRYDGQWGAAAKGADFQAIVAGMMQTEGASATQTWLQGLKDHAQIYQNNIATMKAVNAGEVSMGVIYHYYWYRDQALTKEGSANTKLHYFRGQDAGAFVSVSGGAVLKSAAHSAQARQFLAFVTSPAGQQILADSSSMEYAVGVGIASAPALPPLDTLQAPTVDLFDLDGKAVVVLETEVGIL